MDDKKKDLGFAQDIEVTQLSDEDLESVAGGAMAGDSDEVTECCSYEKTECCDTEVA